MACRFNFGIHVARSFELRLWCLRKQPGQLYRNLQYSVNKQLSNLIPFLVQWITTYRLFVGLHSTLEAETLCLMRLRLVFEGHCKSLLRHELVLAPESVVALLALPALPNIISLPLARKFSTVWPVITFAHTFFFYKHFFVNSSFFQYTHNCVEKNDFPFFSKELLHVII